MDSEPIVIEISSDEEDFSSKNSSASFNWNSEPMENINEAKEEAENGLDDDYLSVGKKGQLACIDYPHPRHLCAFFPFSTTLHEKHCELCHCCVCDSPAPCLYWGEHCHATDKEQWWEAKWQNFKESCMAYDTASIKPLAGQPSNSSPPLTTRSSSSQACPSTNPHPKNILADCPLAFSFRSQRPTPHLLEENLPEAEPKPKPKFQLFIPGMLHKFREHREALAVRRMQSWARLKRVAYPESGLIRKKANQSCASNDFQKDRVESMKGWNDNNLLNNPIVQGSSTDRQIAASPLASLSLSHVNPVSGDGDGSQQPTAEEPGPL